MNKLGFAILAALPLLWPRPALPAPPTSPEGQAGFGEQVEVNVVNVEAYVTDRDGNPVPGLRREDFAVLEDGKPMEVVNFEEVGAPPPAAPVSQTASPPPTVPAADHPLRLTLYFDNLHIRAADRLRVLTQLHQFITRLSPRDEVMLVTHENGLHVRLPFTSDRAALAEALRQLETLPTYGDESDRSRRTAYEALVTLQEVSAIKGDPCGIQIAQPVESYAQSTRQEVLRTLAGLTVVVNSLSGVPGNKALLYVSNGLPLTPGEELYQVLFEMCGGGGAVSGLQASPEAGVYDARELGPAAYPAQQALTDAQQYSTATDLQALVAHANANRVTFYMLQASGPGAHLAGNADGSPRERLLQSPSVVSVQTTNLRQPLTLLAADTGGRALLDTNDFLPDLARMRDDLSRYYSLGYSPPHQGDGRNHRIEVRVKRPGLRVRHRQTYRDKPALERTVDRVLASLLYGYEDNPLEVQVEVGEGVPVPEGKLAVTIRLRIPLFKLAILTYPDRYEGKLRLLVAVRSADGASTPLRQVEVPIRVPRQQVLTAMGQYYLYELTLHLKPGEQRVAVAVRDEAAATASFLTRTLQVGDVQAKAHR